MQFFALLTESFLCSHSSLWKKWGKEKFIFGNEKLGAEKVEDRFHLGMNIRAMAISQAAIIAIIVVQNYTI